MKVPLDHSLLLLIPLPLREPVSNDDDDDDDDDMIINTHIMAHEQTGHYSPGEAGQKISPSGFDHAISS